MRPLHHGGDRMSNLIRIGVVGVGSLGSQHARIYSELAKRNAGQYQFVGIHDTDNIKVRAMAEKYGGGTFETAPEITVAWPSQVA